VKLTRLGSAVVMLAALVASAATFAADAAPSAGAPGQATAWRTDPGRSQLTFHPRLAGGEFECRFERFDASVRFDPADLAHSSLQVVVDLLSARTGDDERDTALQGPDFFSSSRWPQARFTSVRIRALGGDRYEAAGKLTLRNVTREVSLPFRFKRTAGGGGSARLEGATSVWRLEFGVGQGEWRGTEWLDDVVRIEFALALESAR
jgi:polyisoprenoid-binding protein YceI